MKGLQGWIIKHTKTLRRSGNISARMWHGSTLRVKLRLIGAKGSIVTGTKREPVKDTTPTLSDLGLTKKESSDAQFLAKLPEEEFKKVKTGKKKVSVLKREQKRKEDNQAIKNKTFPVIEGKFKAILVDPPWDYELNLDGRAKPEYEVMSLKKIKELHLDNYAEKNCHLYIWSTNNNIPLALELGEAWGFSYKTLITWVKPSIGMGSYFRNSTEQLLFFVKGQLSTRTTNIPTHFEAPREGHSKKPERSYKVIEDSSYPSFLEIFGRKERKNWVVWGNIDV